MKKQRWEESGKRREEEEDQRREKVRRKKMQVREKVRKSQIIVWSCIACAFSISNMPGPSAANGSGWALTSHVRLCRPCEKASCALLLGTSCGLAELGFLLPQLLVAEPAICWPCCADWSSGWTSLNTPTAIRSSSPWFGSLNSKVRTS